MNNNQPLSGYEYLRTQDALNAHVVVSVADAKGDITYVNDNFCHISGYERDELLGQNHRILKSGHHPPEFYDEMWQTLLSGEIWTGEICNRSKNGNYYWVKATITPFLDEQGKPYKYVSYRTDITKIKIQEQTHLELLNSMGEGVFGIDKEGLCTFINQAALTILGYEQEELIGKYLHEEIHCYQQDGTPNLESECAIFKTLNDKHAHCCESWFLDKSGKGFNVSLTITPRYEHDDFIGVLVSFHDISLRKNAELRLSVAIEGAGDGIWDWDMSTNAVHFSELYAKMLGYSVEEMLPELGTWIHNVHPEDWARVQSTLQSYLEGNLPRFEIEFRMRCKDGSWKWILSRGKVVALDSEGNPIRMTGVHTDIDVRKKMESELLHAKVAAEAANQAKSEFLSSMSHELRTPLNAVIGFAQILEGDAVSPLTTDQKDSLKHISNSGHHLLTLINDVLELAKIETGNIPVVKESVVFSDVIDECLPILQNLAAANNVEIIVNDMSDTAFYADCIRVKQVLLNLCTNAIKYNEIGGQVTIDCMQSERNLMRINITDTGIGIVKEKQDQLFTAFNRLGQENSGIEGTGVGLIITKKLIDAMNGEIGFKSVDGLGSIFWFELPVIEKEVNQLSKRFTENLNLSDVGNTEKGESMKAILYIEDNLANIKLMQAFFARDPQLSLQVVTSAEEGIDKIVNQCPDLILMDINLPGMSGNEAAEQLKNDKVYRTIPIIALSAVAMKHDIEKFEGLFDAYITKPVDFTVLMKEIERQLGKHNREMRTPH
ncbi:hypothetical protein A9Q92_00860 [Methylophaga sp. 42_8_T64]|nr:hypothetical protein A9Q92_00860 [Methylophaga sp. 42_8_T64]